MTNSEIAQVFRQVAAVYQLAGKDLFHVRAYENAAQSIESFTTPLKEIWQEGKLDEVPGIGESFTKYLDELFRTGRVKHFEKLMNKAPAGMYPLLEIPGVGPKTAWKLSKGLGLGRAKTAIAKLSAAFKAGKIGKLLSPKMATKLQNALLRTPGISRRMLLLPAEQIAEDVSRYLNDSEYVLRTEVLGSVRRRVPTIGDIDIAVASHNPEEVVTHLAQFPHLRRLISAGEKMFTFEHTSGRQIDVKISRPESWGDMLVHYTGSKLHNIQLRTLALDQKKSISEFGIEYHGKKITHETEAELYRELGIPWIAPELREGGGEIEIAARGKLPNLVELGQIKGDLHVHSNLVFPSSHDMGEGSVAELVEKAATLGYSYLGLSDHGPKHQDFSAQERFLAVKKRSEQIEKIVSDLKSKHKKVPRVFIGLEVDILADGALSLEDEALLLLDFVIVSIHAQFELNESQQTQRILKALTHPKVAVLGHPTGRQLLSREEIRCDWRQVFTVCAQEKKILEINASINRLDLPYPLIRLAGEMGCKFVINTDAHKVSDMDLMRFGVDTARKGWASADMVVNTKKVLILKGESGMKGGE